MLVKHLLTPETKEVLGNYYCCCYCHFTVAEGVPCGDGTWGSLGEMEIEKDMCSKPAERYLSCERNAMAIF